MRKVRIDRVKPGDLVQVPRTQFAPMRRGWNGWLFSEAVVLRTGIGKKTGRPVVTVKMRTPGKVRNAYGTVERTFHADCVFEAKDRVSVARQFMEEDGVTDKASFEAFIQRDDVTGCDWIRFLVDHGFLFNEEQGDV